MSLHPCFRRRWLLQVCPQEAGLCGHQCFSVVAQATAKIRPRPAQGLYIFKRKNLIEQLKPLLEWLLYEKAQYDEFNVPTCGKIAVCQLCRERQPVWNSHDGLNLTCLDQCHGVRSHGTSSSQGWRKRLVIQQSEFDPWVHILVFAEGDCCRFA